MWILLALSACTNEITLSYSTDNCENWDFDAEEPELRVDVGDTVVMSRVGVQEDCNASFAPEFQAHGWLIQVFEVWEPPEEELEICTYCFAPTVEMLDASEGDYELQWFEGTDTVVPAHTTEFTVGS